jgi:RNA-directed DNA polymerase
VRALDFYPDRARWDLCGGPPARAVLTANGAFYRTALYPVLHRINTYLLRWIMNKYKRLSTWKKATQAMRDAIARNPQYFAHWSWAKPALR